MKIVGPIPSPGAMEMSEAFIPFEVTCINRDCLLVLLVDEPEDIRYTSHYIGYGDDWSFYLFVACPKCNRMINIENYGHPGDPGLIGRDYLRPTIPLAVRTAAWEKWWLQFYENGVGTEPMASCLERFFKHGDVAGWATHNPDEVQRMREMKGL